MQVPSNYLELRNGEWVSDLVFIERRFLTARVLWATDRPPGNETKDESAPDLNTPGFEPEIQWSEVECSTTRPSTPRAKEWFSLPISYFIWYLKHERV